MWFVGTDPQAIADFLVSYLFGGLAAGWMLAVVGTVFRRV
jgi:hypothetical protein